MNKTKFLKGECQHCGGRLEFPAEMAGLTAECPHCGQQTDLLLAAPPEEPTIPRRTVVWAIIGIVILVMGLVGALAALKRAERWAARQKRQAESSFEVQGSSSPLMEAASPKEDPQAQNG